MAAVRSLYRTDLAHIHDSGFGDLSRDVAPALLRILRDHGLRRAHIVEAGCGSGILAKRLADAGHHVVGIDASEAMIRLARARAPRARFRVASLTTAFIPRCDAVIAIGEVLTYLPSWRAVRRFIARVHAALPPGALFLFDFIESAEWRTYAPKTMTGGDWTMTVRADVSRDGRVLTRRMTTVSAVGTKKRRAHETHRVRIYSREEMIGALATAGFRATMGRSFRNYRLMTGDVAVIARSDYDVPL